MGNDVTTLGRGDRIPSVTLKRLGDDGMEEVTTDDLFAGKLVVLFSVPGAFTPTCSNKHLPGFVAVAETLRERGVDDIICLAVNDPYVMKAWGKAHGADDKVTMLPDWNADLTRAIGLLMDGARAGLGARGKRYSMIVDDGVITTLNVDEKPGVVDSSSADTCLELLR